MWLCSGVSASAAHQSWGVFVGQRGSAAAQAPRKEQEWRRRNAAVLGRPRTSLSSTFYLNNMLKASFSLLQTKCGAANGAILSCTSLLAAVIASVSACPLHTLTLHHRALRRKRWLTLVVWIVCVDHAHMHVGCARWGQCYEGQHCCRFKQLIARDVAHMHSRWTSAGRMLWHGSNPDVNLICNITGSYFIFFLNNKVLHVLAANLLSYICFHSCWSQLWILSLL